MAWTALGLGLVVVAVGIGLVAIGRSRWQASTQAQMARLEAARVPTDARRYDAREIDGLPAPVQRYFRAVLKDGQPRPILSTDVRVTDSLHDWITCYAIA